MSILSFKYDIKRDAWNWAASVLKRPGWGRARSNWTGFLDAETIKKIESYKNEKLATNYCVKLIENHPQKLVRDIVIKEQVIAAQKVWGALEKRIFARIEKVTQSKIYFNKAYAYITTANRCPYNQGVPWFMVGYYSSNKGIIKTCIHELLHFQFLHYYRKELLKEMTDVQIEHLKEALTFLINTDFTDLCLDGDMGYPTHQELRKKLEKIWLKDKDFKNFLPKAIELTKKMLP